MVRWFLCLIGIAAVHAASADDAFDATIMPILKTHCFECHSEAKTKGDLRLDNLSPDMINDRAAMETWHDALTAIQLGEMPPEGAKPLSKSNRTKLLSWIRTNLDAALESVKGSGSGVVMRRMNRDEYAYTMTDLLGLEMDYAADLPPDAISKDGFLNNGEALGMSSMQLSIYLRNARRAMDMVLVEGDQPEREVESIQHNRGFKLRGTRADNSDQLGRAQHWIGTSNTLPASGPFTVRVKARTDWQTGQATPRLGLKFGYFVGGLTTQFLKQVGEVKVQSNDSVVIEFRGRAEFLPKPESSIPRNKLQTLFVLQNTLHDAQPRPKQIAVTQETEPSDSKRKKPKKRKQAKVFQRDPSFPQIYIESVEFVMNDYEAWPPSSHRRILPVNENLASDDSVGRVLGLFLSRAWRRPATKKELREWTRHYQKIRRLSRSDIGALRETLAASLASTPFLYMIEPRKSVSESRELNSYELASRLSYFIWSSAADEELMQLAKSGDLHNEETLVNQFDRMLADPKSSRFVDQFCTQWLDLDSLGRVAINPQYYKGFDDALKHDMAMESKLLFSEVLRHDLSALRLLKNDFTMLNAALAKHYGISGPNSQEFVRVALAKTDRPSGLLGHAAMHMAGSDGANSHPIKRAVWIRERLLADPPDPPPPDVPDIESTVKDFEKMTVREQLEIHQDKAACADCHRSIDPWGIALEHFDAIGLRREKVGRKRKPVDAKTMLPGQHAVNDVEGLQQYLLENRRDQFAETLVKKMMAYALGRSLELVDQPVIDDLTERFAEHEFRLSALMRDIVTSQPFLNR